MQRTDLHRDVPSQLAQVEVVGHLLSMLSNRDWNSPTFETDRLVRVAFIRARTYDFNVYVLKLEDDCFYVGVSKYPDVQQRIRHHISGVGSAWWTQLHRPLMTVEIRQLGRVTREEALREENLTTLEYIDKYGVEVVKGGEVCSVPLEKCRRTVLRLRSRYAEDGRPTLPILAKLL